MIVATVTILDDDTTGFVSLRFNHPVARLTKEAINGNTFEVLDYEIWLVRETVIKVSDTEYILPFHTYYSDDYLVDGDIVTFKFYHGEVHDLHNNPLAVSFVESEPATYVSGTMSDIEACVLINSGADTIKNILDTWKPSHWSSLSNNQQHNAIDTINSFLDTHLKFESIDEFNRTISRSIEEA